MNPAPAKTPLDSWAAPPGDVRLGEDEVHVWRAKLGRAGAEVQRLRQMLAPDELERARRFRFEEHRHHFVVARGLLRGIISLYLGVEPRRVRFCYNPYGKPSLTHEPDNGLRFNLSHSCGLALYAVTRSREVGIDIERVRTEFEGMDIAARFFSRREVAALESLPKHLRAAAFFNCWTRKEAYIKARGEGLSLPLDEFDVSLTPGEPAALLRTAKDPHEAGRWSLRELRPGVGYAAALAMAGRGWRLRQWQWPES